MKEIKPRLIFTDGKRRSWTGSARHLVIILITFCVGVYVGFKVNDMDLNVGVQKEAPKDQAVMLEDGIASKSGGGRTLTDEDKVSVQGSSSSDVGKPVTDTYAQQEGPGDGSEREVNGENSQDYADQEQVLDIEKKDGFTVQIGAFKEVERANKALNELKIKGYRPYILPYVNSLGTNWYLVRIGKFNTREEASEYAYSFQRTEGLEAIVERIE